jgi:hypothetical protein
MIMLLEISAQKIRASEISNTANMYRQDSHPHYRCEFILIGRIG